MNDAAAVHQVCWADLATPDEARAAAFYSALFGWSARKRYAGGGHFATLEQRGVTLASIYALAATQVAAGVPAHWMPYVSTPDVGATASCVAALGGRVIVPPRAYPGLARAALVADPTGALLGLWQDVRQRCARTLDDQV